MPVRYYDAVSGTLNASGAATVNLRQCPPSHTIDVDEIALTCAGATTPSARLIHGHASSPLVVDQTRTAGENRSSPQHLLLHPGENMAVLFANGTPGAAFTVTLRGTLNP